MVGCSEKKDLKSSVDSAFSDEKSNALKVNNYTQYIEYYLPSDVNEQESDLLSFVFDVDGSEFIMNINIAGVINNKYYTEAALKDEGFFDSSKMIYSKTGKYINVAQKEINYFVKAYDYGQECLIYFLSNQVSSYAYCQKTKAELVASKIFQMAKNSDVKEEEIIANFSSKDVIDYKKGIVDLFENIFPVDGRIEDIIIGDNSEVPEE